MGSFLLLADSWVGCTIVTIALAQLQANLQPKDSSVAESASPGQS